MQTQTLPLKDEGYKQFDTSLKFTYRTNVNKETWVSFVCNFISTFVQFLRLITYNEKFQDLTIFRLKFRSP